MKKIAWLTALVLVGQMVSAQVVRPALDDDPVFHKVLHDRIDYPLNTFHFPLYGRVYAGFCIDAKGKVGNVMILSPGNTRSGFEYEVVHALKHMPILNPKYAGDYVLPVAFCYINEREADRVYRPTNTLPDSLLQNRLLLKEWPNMLKYAPRLMPLIEPKEVWGYYTKK